jgi:hypothetical protein
VSSRRARSPTQSPSKRRNRVGPVPVRRAILRSRCGRAVGLGSTVSGHGQDPAGTHSALVEVPWSLPPRSWPGHRTRTRSSAQCY